VAARGFTLLEVLVAVAIVLGRLFDNRGLGGEHHARHRRGVEHRGPGHLDGVDDAIGGHVTVGQRGRVEAVTGRQPGHLVDHDGPVQSGVGGGTPRPRKLRLEDVKIAKAIVTANCAATT